MSSDSRITQIRFGRVHASSPAMIRALDVLARAAPSEVSVLIEGEIGTGKSLAAEAVHTHSRRATRPLVVVDCGALPSRLAECELFGHERGAYSDAGGEQPGAFEQARGGTLVLDEIAELPADLQPKLLRALDKHAVTRVGGNHAVATDVRVIATTSRPLGAEMAQGNFRPELYYRLNVVSVRLPPLRERPEDIPALAAHFFARLGAGRTAPPALLALLGRRDWPGNVRELRNAVERLLVLDDLTDESAPPPSVSGLRDARAAVISRWEEAYLRTVLELTDGNATQAARAADVDYKTLRGMMRKYGIDAR